MTSQTERGYILIVEDDPDLRGVETEILRMEGFAVRPARDGVEALEVIEEAGAPALVLLDLRMPRLNGWDLAARLRADRSLSRIPIVVVAAHYAIGDEAAAIGARAWLRKPAGIDELLAVVRRIHDQQTGEVA